MMTSTSEVSHAAVLYLCLSIIITLIYIFTENEKLAIDFSLHFNDTSNIRLRLNDTANIHFSI